MAIALVDFARKGFSHSVIAVGSSQANSGIKPWQPGFLIHRIALAAAVLKAPVLPVMLRPNNSFKPKPLRSGKNMAEKACHVFTSTTRFGLTQALGRKQSLLHLQVKREEEL